MNELKVQFLNWKIKNWWELLHSFLLISISLKTLLITLNYVNLTELRYNWMVISHVSNYTQPLLTCNLYFLQIPVKTQNLPKFDSITISLMSSIREIQLWSSDLGEVQRVRSSYPALCIERYHSLKRGRPRYCCWCSVSSRVPTAFR